MAIADLFRPKWKHSDSRVRKIAVERLTDQAVLVDIAKSDKAREVRKAAVQRVTDQAVLAQVAENDESEAVAEAAAKRVTDQTLLADVAQNASSQAIRTAAIEHLTDQTLLADIARNEKDKEVRKAAVERVTDQGVLAHVAQKDKDRDVREAALERVVDQSVPADERLKIVLRKKQQSERSNVAEVAKGPEDAAKALQRPAQEPATGIDNEVLKSDPSVDLFKELLALHCCEKNRPDKPDYKKINELIDKVDDFDKCIKVGSASGTLFSMAIYTHDANIVESIVKKGVPIKDEYIIAAGRQINEAPTLIFALLEHNINVDATDSNGWSLLHILSFEKETGNTIRLARTLLNRGANLEVKDKKGVTPLESAKSKLRPELMKLYSDPSSYRDDPGAAIIRHSRDGNIDEVKKSLEKKVNVNVRDENGCNALWHACYGGHYDIVRILISSGADIDIRDAWSLTPLMQAIRLGHLRIAELLLESGADRRLTSNEGYNALGLAMFMKQGNHTNDYDALIDSLNSVVTGSSGRCPIGR